MPFNAGPARAEPPSSDDLPIDWLNWAQRIIVFGTLMVLWLAWASILNAIVQSWGLA